MLIAALGSLAILLAMLIAGALAADALPFP